MFHRHTKKAPGSSQKVSKNSTQTTQASSFLAENKRPLLLEKIRNYMSLDEAAYNDLCQTLLEDLVHYCQKLPETTTSYYAQAGGLVDHALNRTEAALNLFQNFLLQDPSQPLSEQQKLWQYALFSVAILQNIGTLFVDYKVQMLDSKGQVLKNWNPLEESLMQAGAFYDYELANTPDVIFKQRVNVLLARDLIPARGFSWIASDPQVLAVWLALLNEDHRGAGTLSAILIRADALAIQRYLNEFMSKINAKRSLYGGTGAFIDAPQESLLEKEQALGIEFIQWLAKSLEEGRFSLDQGLIVAVSGSLFLTKELFQIFMKDTHRTNWQALQNGFLALGMYVKDGQGKAILRIEQSQDKEMLSGVGFAKYGLALPDHIKTKTGEMLSAETLIHSIEQRSTQSSQKALEIKQLPKISAQGAWQFSPVTTNSTEAREPSSPRPGVRQGG